MSSTLPYGSWPSAISADDVAAGAHPVDAARYVGDEIWWSERVPAERGITTVFRRDADGDRHRVLPAGWGIGSRVHEYGGGAWTTDRTGTLYFVGREDQRVWRLAVGDDEPRPLTPEDDTTRYGELTITAGQLLAVRERHSSASVPERHIVRVGTDHPGVPTPLVGDSDFVAYPRISPDGRRLAWIAWNHPDMPWDRTELRLGDLGEDGVLSWRALRRDAGSIVQPEWSGDEELTYASDHSGRWNLERVDVTSGTVDAFSPADADTGGPLWNLGVRWYLLTADGGALAVRTHGTDELTLIERDGGIAPLRSPVSARVLLQDLRQGKALFTGAGAQSLGGLWELDLTRPDDGPRLVRGHVDDAPDDAWLPRSRAIEFDGPRGPVHAFAYAPTHPTVSGPADERPPYLVLAHGGPTSHVSGEASLAIAYFTSRGIGVLDVNYGGSTGYGRAYRERLRGAWGVVDRDDVIAAAHGLASSGIADADRLAIRGGSAGGWTVLCALTASDLFAAGISRYGVADLRALAAETHDFEARYLDGLVGPLPEADQLYRERSPLSHPDRFRTPMLIEQGLDDPVVPPAQSEAVRDALAARGIAHAYLTFPGEAHGFRRPETLRRSLEAEVAFLGEVLGFDPDEIPALPLDR